MDTATNGIQDDGKVLLEESAIHHPQLVLPHSDRQSSKWKTINEIMSEFVLSRTQVDRIRAAFRAEILEGLHLKDSERTPATTSMKMVNTFVPGLQSVLDRSELAGDYLALDIGSTNFRVLHVPLTNGGIGQPRQPMTVKYYDIPYECRRGESSKLFNFLAESIENFADTMIGTESEWKEDRLTYHKPGQLLPLGFTFSFPMRHYAINIGYLMQWTKNFHLPDAVGKDVCRLLQQALDERGNRHRVRVVAVLNDSTGTLIKGAYLDPDCAIGVIMGSGHNACYLERIDRIVKWNRRHWSYDQVKEVAVNMECGAFGDNGSIDFINNRFDRMVDQHSLFPGSFTFEKHLSGLFLGELLRHVLVYCVQQNLLANGILAEKLTAPESIRSSDISMIENDNTGTASRQVLERLGYRDVSDDDAALVQYACARISIRAATLLAATLSVLIERVQRPRVVVAIDGSLYKKHPKMQTLMQDFITELLPPGKRFQLIHVDDGSGKGAGIVAALATKLSMFRDQYKKISTDSFQAEYVDQFVSNGRPCMPDSDD